jgi:hypothetical protein
VNAIFIGFVFALVLMACFIAISLIRAKTDPNPHLRPGPSITDADAVPLPPHHPVGDARSGDS